MELSQTESELQTTSIKVYEQRLERKRKQQFLVWVFLIISLGVAFLTYRTINEVKDYENRRIWIMNDQISVKRWNQNTLKKLGNVTYNEYPQDGHFYSQVLNDRLIKYYKEHKIESVADFGCGKCEYILNLNAAGFQAKGFDGHPWNEDNSTNVIQKMDLSQNITLPFIFDYVQSFEVGEHIYSDFEDNFIHNLVSHAKKGIILSWGILGQTGFLHVNNRDNDYLIPKVEAYGFTFDRNDAMMLREGFTNHFANTIMVFHKN